MSASIVTSTAKTDSAFAPFVVRRPTTIKAPVIFASPHSGNYYPKTFQAALKVPLMDLRRTEDAFVDTLFSASTDKGTVQLTATHGRSFVDLNRDARELDASMFTDGVPRTCGLPSARVKAGLGSLPRVGASGQHIYAVQITRAEGSARLSNVHDAYHGALSQEIETLTHDWSDVVLIDCHSMPSKQPGRQSLPDIVLGDRFGSSCSGKLTGTVERAFRRSGFSVVRNAPYAGGYTTRRYGRPRRGVHALQIEINRGLYMDEQAVEKAKGFAPLCDTLSHVMDEIIAYALRENG